MPTYVLTIDGVVKSYQQQSLQIALVANGQDAWACDILSEGRAYVPVLGVEASLTEDGNPLVAGILDRIDEEGAGGEPILDALYHLSFVGYDSLMSRRYVNETFAIGTTLKQMLQRFETNYPTIPAWTLDPAQVTGPSLTEELIIKDKLLSEVLDDLSTWSGGLLWKVSTTKVLSMSAPASPSAPFSITDSDSPRNTKGQVRKVQAQKALYNTVIVTGGGLGIQDYCQQFIGDGVASTFALDFPIVGYLGPSLNLDQAIGYGVVDYGTCPISTSTESLGETNSPSGFIWEYNTGVPVDLTGTATGTLVDSGTRFFGFPALASAAAVPTGLSLATVGGGTVSQDVPDSKYGVFVTAVDSNGNETDPDCGYTNVAHNGSRGTFAGVVQTITVNGTQQIQATWNAAANAVKYRVYLAWYYFGARVQQFIEVTAPTLTATFTTNPDWQTIATTGNITPGASLSSFGVYWEYAVAAVYANGETPLAILGVGTWQGYRRPIRVEWIAPQVAPLSYKVYRRPASRPWDRYWSVAVGTTFFDDDQLNPGTTIAGAPFSSVAPSITRRTGPVANGVSFFLRYQVQYPIRVQAVDSASILTHGIRELRRDFPSITSRTELQALANSLLAQHVGDLEEIVYQTFNPGIRTGMLQAVTCLDRDIAGNWLITEVRARSYEALVEWSVRAVGGSRFRGSFRDLYAAWLRIGMGSSASSPMTLAPPGSGGRPGLPYDSLQWNKLGVFAGSEGTNAGFKFHEAGTFTGYSEIRAYPVAASTKYTRIGVVNTAGDFEMIQADNGSSLQVVAGADAYFRANTGAVSIEGVTDVDLTGGPIGSAVVRANHNFIFGSLFGVFVTITSYPYTVDSTGAAATTGITTHFCGGAGGTVNLPPLANYRSFPATSVRRILVFYNESSGDVTLDGNSAETINLQSTIVIGPQGAVIIHGRTSSDWGVISSSGNVSVGGGSSAGAQGDVQYRGASAGSFDAEAAFNYNETNDQLALIGQTNHSTLKLTHVSGNAGVLGLRAVNNEYNEVTRGFETVAGVATARSEAPSYSWWDGNAETFGWELAPGQTAGNAVSFSVVRGWFFDSNGTFWVYETGGLGTGAKTGCGIKVDRNSSGNGAAGFLGCEDKGGTFYYIWPDDNGVWRTSTTPPEEDGTPSDTHGAALAGTGFNGDGSANTLSADPASPTNGTWWLVDTGTSIDLRARKGGVTHTIISFTLP